VTTNTFHYPFNSVAADYARAGIGLLVVVLVVLFFSVAFIPGVILLLLAAVFAGFGLQTLLRHRTTFRVSDEEIVARPWGTRLRWRELTDVRLEYYALERQSKHGWMQLTLQSGRRRLRIDSRLDGFLEVAQRAADNAYASQLRLSPTTMTNFGALKIGVADNGAG
jgi:hypothetical protein